MDNCLLKVNDLYYKYEDGTCALKGVTLSIEKGSTVAILGGNGAGKSTLFLSMNGIYKPTRGELKFKDVLFKYNKEGLKKLRSKIGMVFQDPDSQLFSASVYQDVSFGPMNMKLPKNEVINRIEWAMEVTGISNLRNKPTHFLSFGQKKRVALAGVLAMRPEILILDEPTAGLDPKGVNDIMKLLKKIQDELGMTIILSTHDMDIVPLYCDYVYVLSDGELVNEGTPRKVLEQASLLRKINLRLPRIAHLMEVLSKKDGFTFKGCAATISEARKEFVELKSKECAIKSEFWTKHS